MGLIGAICATGCAFVLLRGGWWKLRHRKVFAGVLREQLLAGTNVRSSYDQFIGSTDDRLSWLSVAVPLVELVVGTGALVLLVPPPVRPDATLPMLALLLLGVVFAAYSGARLAAGRGGTRCGCVSAEDRLGVHTVVRAVAIAGGGAVGLLADSATGGPPGLLWPVTTAAGGAVVAAMLLVRF